MVTCYIKDGTFDQTSSKSTNFLYQNKENCMHRVINMELSTGISSQITIRWVIQNKKFHPESHAFRLPFRVNTSIPSYPQTRETRTNYREKEMKKNYTTYSHHSQKKKNKNKKKLSIKISIRITPHWVKTQCYSHFFANHTNPGTEKQGFFSPPGQSQACKEHPHQAMDSQVR